MKELMKYAAVGVAGYLVGRYKIKFEIAMLINDYYRQNEKNSKEEKEEAQS